MADRTLAVTGDPDADHLLNTDPLALLLGMLLDQQVPMEWAFRGPATLAERLGGSLDAADIAARPPSEVEDLFAAKPALHRFPGSMGRRAHALCQYLVDHYDGDAEAIWTRSHEGRPPDAAAVFRRLRDLPGYGDEKSKIFLALLVKRWGVTLPGWEDHAGPFADDTPRSVADIDGPDALRQVREWKKLQKSKGKTKQD